MPIVDSRRVCSTVIKAECVGTILRRPPGFIEPCLPTNGRSVPTGPQWAYEIKHDGFRFICRRDGDRVGVFSRRGNDYINRVPRIAEALASLRVKSVTLDGEGVVCGADGVSDFDRLRAALGRLGSRRAFLYAFDILELDGVDLGRELWDERRKVLARLLLLGQGEKPRRAGRHKDHADARGQWTCRSSARRCRERSRERS
jgi:ATP-dependent DNA ligase